jgi:hypothetical protein
MSGNICRCAAYPNIVAAIRDAGGPATRTRWVGVSICSFIRSRRLVPPAMKRALGCPATALAATSDGGLRIGAMVRNSDLAADERVRRDYGVLSRALLAGASGQLFIRSRRLVPPAMKRALGCPATALAASATVAGRS